jgi:hypothetical protein
VAEFAHVRTMRTVLCGISSLMFLVVATSSLAQGQNGNGMFHPAQEESQLSYPNPDRPLPMNARRPLQINSNFPQVRTVAALLPRGATHLIVRSDADAQQIFTYFPCPSVAARSGAVGVYRLEVNSQGNVAAVTILKSMGPLRDARIMKMLITWRARPGSLRAVDISWLMSG